MLKFLRSLIPSIVTGALVGFVVLGIGGRVVMRIIAHWEGRIPVLTEGTVEVLLMGVLAGIAAGIIHGVLLRLIKHDAFRVAVFFAICISFTLFGVSEILPRPKLLFVTITVVYCIVVEVVVRRKKLVFFALQNQR